MIKKIGANSIDFSQLEADLRAINGGDMRPAGGSEQSKGGFGDLLAKGISDVNRTIQAGDKASMDLVSGKSTNIHETMLAVSRAEIGFNMLVQLRNKALEAYQEIMRMQV